MTSAHRPPRPNKFLTNPSGLSSARRPILSPVEAGPHPSWRGSDGPHSILCSLHSWNRFSDLRPFSVDLGRQAPRHCSAGSRPPEGVRPAAAPPIPRLAARNSSAQSTPLRNLSVQLTHHAHRLTASHQAAKQVTRTNRDGKGLVADFAVEAALSRVSTEL